MDSEYLYYFKRMVPHSRRPIELFLYRDAIHDRHAKSTMMLKWRVKCGPHSEKPPQNRAMAPCSGTLGNASSNFPSSDFLSEISLSLITVKIDLEQIYDYPCSYIVRLCISSVTRLRPFIGLS